MLDMAYIQYNDPYTMCLRRQVLESSIGESACISARVCTLIHSVLCFFICPLLLLLVLRYFEDYYISLPIYPALAPYLSYSYSLSLSPSRKYILFRTKIEPGGLPAARVKRGGSGELWIISRHGYFDMCRANAQPRKTFP